MPVISHTPNVEINLPILSVGLMDAEKKKDPHAQSEILDSSNRHIKAAILQAFKGSTVPEYAQKGYRGILNLLKPIVDMEPKEQLDHIRGVFNDSRREGWDCDANGTWQPLFLDSLYGSIAKENGLPRKLLGAGISRSKPPKNKWQMRQFLDGD